MQKLVNINSLRGRFNVAERCEDCGRDGRYCDGGLYGYEGYTARDICEILDDEPEVKAIPIEWLKKKLEQKKQQQYGQFGVAAISKVLMYWEKEYEVKDGASN